MKRKFITTSDQAKSSAIAFIKMLPTEPPYEILVKEHQDTRTTEQNKKMWAMLTDISKQVEWYGHKLTPEDWKCIFSSGLKKEKRVVPNLDGDGLVAIGLYTSKMSIRLMGDMIELMHAFGAERNVKWKAPKHYAEMMETA